MNSFCRLLYKNAFYFTAFTAGMIMAAIIFCSTGKISCLIQLNGFHAKWLNIFFIGLTFLGDGLFSLYFIYMQAEPAFPSCYHQLFIFWYYGPGIKTFVPGATAQRNYRQ